MSDPRSDIDTRFVMQSGLIARAIVDRSGHVLEANPLFSSIFGTDGSIAETVTLADGSSCDQLLVEPASTLLTLVSRTTGRTFIGRLYPVGDDIHILGIHTDEDQLLSRLSTDFTEATLAARRQQRTLVSEAQKSTEAARCDPLTHLPNRRGLEASMDAIGQNRLFSAAMVDIDGFKTINDELGHGAGDIALTSAANIVRSRCRPDDTVARFGGDEFAILFVDTLLRDALAVAERIRAAIEQAADLPECSLTASIGVAQRRDGEACGDVLERADQALYRAKRAGRNRVAS